MPDRIVPRYPIYIPSKGRATTCYTARCLTKWQTPFFLVVEPAQEALYRASFPDAAILVLPWNGNDPERHAYSASLGIEDGALISIRNWIKAHAMERGAARHWQLDDNIDYFRRRYQGKRLYCDPAIALRVCEDFTDRYENIAISGLNYEGFVPEHQRRVAFVPNCHVYSISLILNHPSIKWRLAYNEDTDICLQVLANGWCTVLLNTFVAHKIQTMTVKGGNTAEMYQGDGRLKMARSLERMWPGVVETRRRFHRPQHVVKDAWKRFDTPLRLKPGIDLSTLQTDEYGMELVQVKEEIRSPYLQGLLEGWQAQHGAAEIESMDETQQHTNT